MMLLVLQVMFMVSEAHLIINSNGDLCRKQSNHKTDELMKTGQSVGLFLLAIQEW